MNELFELAPWLLPVVIIIVILFTGWFLSFIPVRLWIEALAAGVRVTFRTLVIGGDKQLPYFREYIDQNPAMGWRSIRVGLDRPDRTTERIGCGALVLACSGFGGNAALVQRNIPEMASALFFGHAGKIGRAHV